MDPQLLHLRLNHLPVVGVLWTLPFLVFALVRSSRTSLVRAHAFTVLLALTTLAAYLTGEPTEQKIEHLPGVMENAIEAHQDAALAALVVGSVAGVVGLLGLAAAMKGRLRGSRTALWVATLVVGLEMGALIKTAYRGGIIHRPELYHGSPASTERSPNPD